MSATTTFWLQVNVNVSVIRDFM